MDFTLVKKKTNNDLIFQIKSTIKEDFLFKSLFINLIIILSFDQFFTKYYVLFHCTLDVITHILYNDVFAQIFTFLLSIRV